MTNSDHDKTLRKFRRERAVGRVLNPAVKGLSKLGLRTAMATELETVGRKTGQLRRVPVSVQFDHDGAWVICQHGTRSGWGRNIVDNPNVRVRQGNQWRAGVAEFRPDDDVAARGRKFGLVGAKVAKALETTPVSVRIDFNDLVYHYERSHIIEDLNARGWQVAHRPIAEMHAANGFQYADDEVAQAFADITYLNAVRS